MSGEWDAKTYDRVAEPQARWGRAVLQRLPLGGGETVLDAGCGTGRVTAELLSRLPRGRVVAVDASQQMIDEARRRLGEAGGRLRYLVADLLDLSPELLEGDYPVDAVLSTATFHWITDHDRLFAVLYRVLRPGGLLTAQCGAAGNLAGLLAAVRSLGVERVGHWLYAAPDETRYRLLAAGFVDVEVWTHPEPTRFPLGEPFADFLESVCLREHVATLPEADRRPFVTAVAATLPEPVLDYVRLNIRARRPDS